MQERASIRTENESEEIHVLDIVVTLVKHKALVLGLPILVGILALAVSFFLPKTYTATARILPPQQKESSAAAMLGALTGGAVGAGTAAAQALGIRNPNDLYAGILQSRTIADRLIERFRLKELYASKTMIDARESLARVTKITSSKDGLLTIEVDDEDPQRAADMANAYLEELDRLMQSLAVTEASQRRLFFEKQLVNAREQLFAAELGLRQAIDRKGFVGVEAQSRAVLGTTEHLRAQIAVKEIQLESMRAFATEQHPEAVRLRQEVMSMRGELANLEGGRRGTTTSASPTGVENVRKFREVKFLEFTVELLTKQYEIAKIDEAKDAVLIQVVDKAIAPDYKSKPKRTLIVMLATFTAGLAALVVVFLKEAFTKAVKDPHNEARIKLIRRYWST